MDIELVKQLLTVTGPIGILAYAMFSAYRADSKSNADRMLDMMKERRDEREQLIVVVQANTAAMTALTATIEHGPSTR
jgi:hypothetical protein